MLLRPAGIGNNGVLAKSTALVSIIVRDWWSYPGRRHRSSSTSPWSGLIYLDITAISNAALLWLERQQLGVRSAENAVLDEYWQAA